jgi:hypothetical protein
MKNIEKIAWELDFRRMNMEVMVFGLREFQRTKNPHILEIIKNLGKISENSKKRIELLKN